MAAMPRGEPRSVPDPEGEQYDAMLRQQRAKREAAERRPANSIGHPGFAESLIPIWGSGREAIADAQDGDYPGAAFNGALAVSDLLLAGSVGKAVAKGGLYMIEGALRASAKEQAWKFVRDKMGHDELGIFEKGQHAHHWLIPQNRWGKSVPAAIKNHPLNLKAMPSAEVHGRIDHRYGPKPRFNPAERVWHGTPAWAKVGAADAFGHPIGWATSKHDKR